MAKKKTAKKPVPGCSTCFYGREEKPDPFTYEERTRCRRYPTHTVFNSTHWCGEFKT